MISLSEKDGVQRNVVDFACNITTKNEIQLGLWIEDGNSLVGNKDKYYLLSDTKFENEITPITEYDYFAKMIPKDNPEIMTLINEGKTLIEILWGILTPIVQKRDNEGFIN
jgi:hypothetical protein